MKRIYSQSLGLVAILACSAFSSPAHCQEVFAGLFRHDAAITRSRMIEGGEDLEIGIRFSPIFASIGGPHPQALILVNTEGGADFASAGLGWKLGSRLYLRPSLGIAVHTGDVHVTPTFQQRHRIPFGSPVLFAPALAAGIEVNKKISIEAAWFHFSHLGLFSKTNPGVDDVGLLLNIRP